MEISAYSIPGFKIYNKNEADIIKSIIYCTCKVYNIPIESIKTVSRIREIKEARQVSMYLIYKYTEQGVNDIAAFFNKDHTTVTHSVHRIRDLISVEPEFEKIINSLKIKCGL